MTQITAMDRAAIRGFEDDLIDLSDAELEQQITQTDAELEELESWSEALHVWKRIKDEWR